MATTVKTTKYGTTEVHEMSKGSRTFFAIGPVGQVATYKYDHCVSLINKEGDNENRFLVAKNGKFGVVGTVGQEMIPCVYNDLAGIFDNTAIVRLGKVVGVVDYNGYELIKPEYREITYEDGVFQCRDKSGNWTFFKLEGRKAVEILVENEKVTSPTHMFKIHNDAGLSSDNYISEDHEIDAKAVIASTDLAKLYTTVELEKAKHRTIVAKGGDKDSVYFIRGHLSMDQGRYQELLMKEKRNFRDLLDDLPVKIRKSVISYVLRENLDEFLGGIAKDFKTAEEVKITKTNTKISKRSSKTKHDDHEPDPFGI